MRRTSAALALIALLAFGACQQKSESATATTATDSQTQQVQSVSISPEQLGQLGAQIEKSPNDAQKLLGDRGLDEASFEQAIRQVSSDPAASQRYRDAYNKARG